MLVLVSTKKTQGQRDNDFSFVPEGEIVTFGFECDGEEVDHHCGCKRSLVGVKGRKATTTFAVADLDVDLTQAIRKSWATWESYLDTDLFAQEDAKALTGIAEHFGAGVVVEKRGAKFAARAT